MSNDFKRYTVTAALIYANGPIHIGHLAGCYLPADTYVRYLKSNGKDAILVSGTDEHGVPITIKAKKEGVSPQNIVDKYYTIIKNSFENFGINFDIYSRTSKKAHHDFSQDFFKTLYDKNVFTEKTTEQYFDEKANQFLADRYIVGTCPNCSNENAYGDQCEKCGSTLSPEELINPRSTLSGNVPIKKSTKNWYLPLDQLQPKIENYINSHKEWKTNVTGQCHSWLKQGLQPRAMTRDLDWGVKVPLDNCDGKVLYVWFDAPIGYITFTKELCDQKGLDWQLYWKNKDSKLVHFIGKDNIVFHSIIFPAMLMQHEGYILPDNVPANEFMNLEGDKISTSRNWAIWLHEYLEEFPNQQDLLRYVLTASAPESKDNDFTWKDFQSRVNNELVAILGNLINRTLVLTDKYYEGIVPTPGANFNSDIHQNIIKEIETHKKTISGNIETFKFREALSQLMNLARIGNKYLADTEPWKLAKTNMDEVNTILYTSIQLTANLAILMEPFMPFSALKISNMLDWKLENWTNNNTILIQSGHKIGKVELVFNKIEDSIIEYQIEKLNQTKKEIEANTIIEVKKSKEVINFDDFTKIDIRIGTILEAEKVPKTDKLLKLKIDTGIDIRTVVSGIAKHFNPNEIIGNQVSILINLAEREIKGIKSQGMILMAEDEKGKLHFIHPSQKVNNGSDIS